MIDRLRDHVRLRHGAPGFVRDPAAVVRALPHLRRWVGWFRPEVRGLERVPREGPCLVVGNHSGGLYTPEAYVIFTALVERFGPTRPVYVLMHDLMFALPWLGPLARRLGCLPADPEHASRALDEGAVVLVFPGGDHEAFRPFWDRTRVDFGGRAGFVRLALQKGVPIVPAVSYGSHETTFVLARGALLARALRLERVRVKIFPWVLGLPWGLVPGFIPVVPWPAKITVQLTPPILPREVAPELPPEDRVSQVFSLVVGVMQAVLDTLVAREPYPLFARARSRRPAMV